MINFVRTLKNSKSGASAAEYALIVAVMGGLVVAGASFFGRDLAQGLENSGDAIDTQSTVGAATAATAPATAVDD